MASCRTRSHTSSPCSTIMAPPSAERAFPHSRFEVPRSRPALRRGLRTEHWVCKYSPKPWDRPHTPGTLRSSHLPRYTRELSTRPILCEHHNNFATFGQPSLNIRRYEVLEKFYLAGRTWKITTRACATKFKSSVHTSKLVLQCEIYVVLMIAFRFQREIQMLCYLHVSQMLKSSGGNGLVRGNTSGL
jgi:hypothetical protein